MEKKCLQADINGKCSCQYECSGCGKELHDVEDSQQVYCKISDQGYCDEDCMYLMIDAWEDEGND